MNTLYQVFETDADLSQEPHKMRYQSIDKDLAETVMVKLFKASYGLEKDFLLYNTGTQDIVCCAFCDSTIAKRGECQS